PPAVAADARDVEEEPDERVVAGEEQAVSATARRPMVADRRSVCRGGGADRRSVCRGGRADRRSVRRDGGEALWLRGSSPGDGAQVRIDGSVAR
ncbi:MAG: hypothetical protein M0032_09110, partial [Actinomycetota bacterium]|nr:hypothetical protein [Actinomycetota bacterium]